MGAPVEKCSRWRCQRILASSPIQNVSARADDAISKLTDPYAVLRLYPC